VADLYLGARLNPKAPRAPAIDETRGPTAGLTRVNGFTPPAPTLADYAGTYVSDEIETTITVEVRDGALVARRRPNVAIALRPHSRDRFEGSGGLGLVTFHRRNGQIVEFGVTQDRVWDLRFTRQAASR
jgi:hypothetical protein